MNAREQKEARKAARTVVATERTAREQAVTGLENRVGSANGIAPLDGSSKVPVDNSPVASEAAPGISQRATTQQVIDGTSGNLFATVAKLKNELDSRHAARRGTTRVTTSPVDNASIAAGASATSTDMRGLGTPAIPSDAKGVDIMITASGVAKLQVDAAGTVPNNFSPRHTSTASFDSTQLSVPLGTGGTSAGKVTVNSDAAVNNVYIWPISWWR